MYQKSLKIISPILPWRKPALIEGANSVEQIPSLIKDLHIKHVLIVTDRGILSLGLMENMVHQLTNIGVAYTIYDQTIPNPTIKNIEDAVKLYYRNNCEAIIAFGGGSSIDCAKGVGARIARPNKSIQEMKGLLKVRKSIPTLFAIPTTAGTGSEATVAAVISNPQTNEKYPISDMSLIPHYAVLDPLLTIKLPPSITAQTGMDALTHAIEAYIGKSNTSETIQCSQEAVKLIFENLYAAFENGSNLIARTNMQKAAYFAGIAFTRAYVGYVHAIAHTLGGFYSIPHGLANAVILPYVLEYYGESVYKPLAELADLVGIGAEADTIESKANMFIDEIRKLNDNMGIPKKLDGIQDDDLPILVERALKEANPLYPVPKILGKNDLTILYQRLFL